MLKINKIIYLLLLGLFLTPHAHAEWVDISPSVEITQTPQALDRVNRQLFSYVTIKNTSGVTIEAPLQLNIIDPSIPVVNADGLSEDFHSYIQLEEDLVSGTEKTVRVSFQLARIKLSFGSVLKKEGALLQMDEGEFYNPPAIERYITEAKVKENSIFAPYIDGSLIVWVIDGVPFNTVQEIAQSIDASVQGNLGGNEYLFVLTKKGQTLTEMNQFKDQLRVLPEIEFVAINYLSVNNNCGSFVCPDNGNDEKADWYHLEESGILESWTFLTQNQKTIGGTEKIVGVIDSLLVDKSSDFSGEHYDLDIGDISSECITNNRIDLIGCKDAIKKTSNKIISLSPTRSVELIGFGEGNESHGTHVTGIIGATHGNENYSLKDNISGIMHDSKILFLRNGQGRLQSIFGSHVAQKLMVNAFDVKIINMSYGKPPFSQVIENKTYCLFARGYLADNITPDIWMQERIKDCGKEGIDSNRGFRLEALLLNQNTSLPFTATNAALQVLKNTVVDFYLELRRTAEEFYKKLNSISNPKAQGVLFIMAAGNDNQSASFEGGVCSLSSYRSNVLCVAALKKPVVTGEHEFWAFSNYGPQVDIATFGQNIQSTVLKFSTGTPQYYERISGTSQATPIVSGIAGLIWNAYPDLTAPQIRTAIVEGGRKASSLDLTDCAKVGELKQMVQSATDPSKTSIPVANAYCALKYAEKLNQIRLQPKNLKAIAGEGEVQLTWDLVDNATRYTIYSTNKSTSEDITEKIYSSILSFPYTMTGLENNAEYAFTVVAEDNSGESLNSNLVVATPFSSSPIQNKEFFVVSPERVERFNVSFESSTYTVSHPSTTEPDGTGNFSIDSNGSIIFNKNFLLNIISTSNADYYEVEEVRSTNGEWSNETAWLDNNYGVGTVAGFNDDINALKDHFLGNGLWESSITADGKIERPDSNVVGKWWIEGSIFYFDYPDSDTNSLDHKAYKLEAGQLLLATDAKYTDLSRFYFDMAKADAFYQEIIAAPISDDSISDNTLKDKLLAVGWDFTCAINKATSKVECWGNNSDGQLDSDTVTFVNPKQVVAGARSACALDDNGVQCWGENVYGQQNTPSLSNPIDISAGVLHYCALDDNGVHCWGNNQYGQNNVPDNLQNPSQISVGNWHSCALDDTGVRCWGGNSFFGASDVPDDLVNPTLVSAGGGTCALDDNGVRCWGSSGYGNVVPSDLLNPVNVITGLDVYTCAQDDSGLRCWGRGLNGVTTVPNFSNNINILEVRAGYSHVCVFIDAISYLGAVGVHCWGNNDYGQLNVPNHFSLD